MKAALKSGKAMKKKKSVIKRILLAIAIVIAVLIAIDICMTGIYANKIPHRYASHAEGRELLLA